MNRRTRLLSVLLLSCIMAVLSVGSAFAAPENYGPAFDPKLNGQSGAGAVTSEVPYGPGYVNSGSSAQTAAAPYPDTLLSPGSYGPGTSNSSSTVIHPSLPAPDREPRLQTTVLLSDTHQWSSPYVNDQVISVDNRQFYSISTFLENIIGNVLYRTYTSGIGWSNWAMNGQHTDVPGNLGPVEAIQYRFSGPVSDKYDIYYMAILNNGQHTSWAKNGATVGTMGRGLHIVGYRLAYFQKGTHPNLDTSNPLVANTQDGIQFMGSTVRYVNGDGSNHTGWGWNGDDRYYFVDSWPVTGWQYIDGYKYYFDGSGKLVQDVEPLIGNAGPFQIKINKEMNCLTIYAQDGGNGFIIPVKSFLTSTGDDTPLGTFHIPEKYRWRPMINNVYSQYATRLGKNMRILMHSIIYDQPNPYTVWASTYNGLGTARSAGCIRLTTADAKWIYDHCPVGTAVTVYNSRVAGPFERPTIEAEIAFEQTWDPTDPDVTAEGIASEIARIRGQQ